MEYCLLHGLGQSPADWAAVEAGLPGQKILCPDLAAWLADRPVTYESLLEGLEAQCAGREEAMVLCGCSLGAILALDYAWRHPRRVSALVLIAPRVRMPRGGGAGPSDRCDDETPCVGLDSCTGGLVFAAGLPGEAVLLS